MSLKSFNLCNFPPWAIASKYFNDNPQQIEIQGVKESNRFLFNALEKIKGHDERAEFFNDYMSVKFCLHQWRDQTAAAGKSIRNSYLRYLRGWMMDSNSVEGAILKRWVESRIGIPPSFHKEPIPGTSSQEYFNYMVEVMKGSARTNAILSQLDILYEYCQFELANQGDKLITLFRGTNDAAEHDILEQLGKREQLVRINNLVSFTSDEERAWEFGSTVWSASVPVSKVFFYNGLLPGSIMKGEGEYMVIGGEFIVKRIMCSISPQS